MADEPLYELDDEYDADDPGNVLRAILNNGPDPDEDRLGDTDVSGPVNEIALSNLIYTANERHISGEEGLSMEQALFAWRLVELARNPYIAQQIDKFRM